MSDGRDKKLVVRANQHADFHYKIVDRLAAETGLEVVCLGGGLINIDPDAKSIKIWGLSGDFGVEPSRKETTAKLLQAVYPDFAVVVGSDW